MKAIVLTILLTVAFSSSSADRSNVAADFILFNTINFCSNPKYIKCMQITKYNCIESFDKSINYCMTQKHLSSYAPSPVCVTNNYFKNLKTKDEIIESCEYITLEVTSGIKQRLMPNSVKKLKRIGTEFKE